MKKQLFILLITIITLTSCDNITTRSDLYDRIYELEIEVEEKEYKLDEVRSVLDDLESSFDDMSYELDNLSESLSNMIDALSTFNMSIILSAFDNHMSKYSNLNDSYIDSYGLVQDAKDATW